MSAREFMLLSYKLCLSTFPNTGKRVENTTHSGVFLTNFSIETKTKEKTENKIIKISANQDQIPKHLPGHDFLSLNLMSLMVH